MSNINSLDIETESLVPEMASHAALEPWRLRQGKAKISSIAVNYKDGSIKQIINNNQSTWVNEVTELLESLSGEVVYAHNALFDIAWLIAQLNPVRTMLVPQVMRDIKWRDTMLLTKWLINGQKAEDSKFSYSLANLVKTFLPDHEGTEFFVKMKTEGENIQPGENPEYWELRGELDVIMTKALAERLQERLPAEQRKGFMTEQECLLPVANSWILGIRIDQKQMRENDKYYKELKTKIAKELNVDEAVFTSSKRLGEILYNQWMLPVIATTPAGEASCSAETLKWLAFRARNEEEHGLAEKIEKILQAKTASTMHSKYVKSMIDALEHTTDGYIYSAPRLFGTNTGRFTYSNSTSVYVPGRKTRKQFKSSIALHQIPRREDRVRRCLLPPEGFKIMEADAAQQESRLMAIAAKDENMINAFNSGKNLHSVLAAQLNNMTYEDFTEKYESEKDGGPYTEKRQLGKLGNLSCNYRISGRRLAEKAYVQYDTYMTDAEGISIVKGFAKAYPRIPEFWDDAIWFARQNKLTKSFANRYYRITKWGGRDAWSSESNAINHVIQGTGGDQKEITISVLFKKYTEALFALDLHDAQFIYLPDEMADELFVKITDELNAIDYTEYWDMEIPIALPFESLIGTSWADVK